MVAKSATAPGNEDALAPAGERWLAVAYPAFNRQVFVADFLARAAWHFSHLPDFELQVPLAPGVSVPRRLQAPEGFDPSVQAQLDAFLSKVTFLVDQDADKATALLERCDVVLKWVEGNAAVDRAVNGSGKQSYRVDPTKVRQEGSYFIQCAFDLFRGKDVAIAECKRKFDALSERIGRHERAWVLATGPSVETYAEHDYSNSVVIACNSVVLNEDIMRVCRPSVLVFADPIFHFGVSGYAASFRDVVRKRLRDSDISIVIPFKYYPLMVARFPEFADRIIGVPFGRSARFNFDITGDFRVRTTSNILTLLLLPLACHFAREVHVTGCDGRPLDQDDYFWGHGASVQINDKMLNIRKVHPGFFDIDYNEYYLEHCHTLENLLREGEESGWRFAHHGPSHIPAFRDRAPATLSLPVADLRVLAQPRRGDARACILLEPDGIGSAGHYVHWHENLLHALARDFDRVDVLCNVRQDPSLYPCPAWPTFSAFSWQVSRDELCYRANFAERERYQTFLAELVQGVRALYSTLPAELSLFIYYGSVQILKAVQALRAELLKEGCSLKASVCLFHESVVVDPGRTEPRLPPNAAGILHQAAAQPEYYRVASVTARLAEFLYERFCVATEVFPNPVPALDDEAVAALFERMDFARAPGRGEREQVVVFPCSRRNEKGGGAVKDFLDNLVRDGVPRGQRYLIRGTAPEGLPPIDRVQFLSDEIDDAGYWNLLQDADLVVIPYLAPAFTYRTSGILVDALVSGTPALVFSGTWLADVVEEHGAGLAVEYRGPWSLASGIKVLLANTHDVRARVPAAAERYLASNSWRATAAFAAK